MRLSMSFHRFGNVFTADAKNAKGLLWRLLTARAKNHLLCGLCVSVVKNLFWTRVTWTANSKPCSGETGASARYECLEGLAHIDILLKAEFISWNTGDQLFDEGEHFCYEAAVIPGY
jgi:hypothetical protein